MSAHHRADVPGAPSRGRLAVLWWTAVGALALHNAEEGLLNLTGWVADTIRHPWFPLRALHGDQTTFTLALGLVTLAVVVLAAVAAGLRPRWSAEVLVCLGCALLLNAASHLMLSLVSWSLMPGAITSAVVLLPVGIGIIRLLPSFRWTPTAVVVIALAMLGTVLGSLLLAAAFGASV